MELVLGAIFLSDEHYVHGTHPEEQARLSRLNGLLNDASFEAMGLVGGERILDVGSGLGQLARRFAAVGSVVGIERDADQLAEARRQASEEGEAELVDFRQGDAESLPLKDGEWGSFDVVHTRFVLEHVTDPPAVVRTMLRAVRPGGRIVLEDDDHELLRFWPEPAGLPDVWRAYYETYERQGKDPFIGRRLVQLLHQAGAVPQRNRYLFFGTCRGDANFDLMIDNFAGIIEGARGEMVELGLIEDAPVDAALAAMREWRRRADASLWYATCWASAVRPES